MPEQRELLLTFPELAPEAPLIPVRMVNEYVYCPRLAYDPERVQLCTQGLLLREHGFECDSGIIYYAGSRERVRVPFDDELVELTVSSINALRGIALAAHIPPPREDSPKCPRCSLVGVCLPDEVRFLNRPAVEPRPLFPALQDALPLYVQSPRAFVRKDGEVFVIEVEKEKAAEARVVEVSQVALFGSTMLSAPALHECFRRNIPVSWHTYGGWFAGHCGNAVDAVPLCGAPLICFAFARSGC